MSNGGIIGADNAPTFFRANGVFTMEEVYLAKLRGQWPTCGNDQFTTLLLHMDGAGGGTTFTDSSSLAQSISAAGVTTDDASVKFGSAAALFSGSGAGLSLSPGTNLDFPGDFTVDFWMKTSTVSLDGGAFRRLVAFQLDNATGMQLYMNASGQVVLRNNNSILTGSTNVATGSWVHVALTRSGTSLKLFVNGTQDASVADSTAFAAGSTARIGSYNGTTGRYLGSIDEFRVTKGIARWTDDFTPRDQPYC